MEEDEEDNKELFEHYKIIANDNILKQMSWDPCVPESIVSADPTCSKPIKT